MKKAFIFFTNRMNLTSAPINIMATKLGEFDNDNNKDIFIIDKQKNIQVITVTEALPEIICDPYFVLIKDDIHNGLPAQNEGQEQGNCKKIQTILNACDEIYLIIHASNPSTCLETFRRLFSEKLKSWIYQSHIENSIYYRILRRELNDETIIDLSFLEDEIINVFPNHYLESLIHLHKSLKLVPLKLQENWNTIRFNEETARLKKTNGIKLAVTKLDNIVFKENVKDYYMQLELIEKEITAFSKTS